MPATRTLREETAKAYRQACPSFSLFYPNISTVMLSSERSPATVFCEVLFDAGDVKRPSGNIQNLTFSQQTGKKSYRGLYQQSLCESLWRCAVCDGHLLHFRAEKQALETVLRIVICDFDIRARLINY
jgi:hypothetical protein